MNQNELVETIKQLKEIKPRKEWAILLKSQILNSASAEQVRVVKIPAEKRVGIMDVISGVLFQKKFAYASATLVFLVIGVFGFARYTMPGDLFYPVKKIAEQTQSPVQVAYNRSEDLVKVVKENKTQNLTPAITEYKASISDAVKNITDSLAKDTDKKSVEEIVSEVKKLQENQKQLETLGVNLGDEKEMSELDGILAQIVENQIADLEETTLTEEQQTTLAKIKDLYSQEKYSEALEEILQMGN